MKTIREILILGSFVWALAITVAQQTGPPETGPQPPPPGETEEAVEPTLPPDGAPPDVVPDLALEDEEMAEAELQEPEGQPPADIFLPGVEPQTPRNPEAPRAAVTRPDPPGRAPIGIPVRQLRRGGPAQDAMPDSGEKTLRLNFRGAPLDLVLDYLSEAAGFIIVLETEVKGKLDVWSNQPLSKGEAVELLNQVLAKNGYAVVQEGRTLTIMSKDEARKRNSPVHSGGDPADIPHGDQVITQIIPVRFVNAVQLSRDLQPLFPPSATIASNEGGNAVVVTDTQSNIRRIAEIIRALDTSISSVSAVRVFPLRYADAKSLATVVRDLFQPQNATRSGNNQQQQLFRGFRGGPPGLAGGQGGAQGAASSGSARVSTPSVVAVADERSNALVVSAPEDQMPVIEELVSQVDVSVNDITVLRVFRLRNSDPQEMADLLTELFEESSSSIQSNAGRGQLRFGGGQFGGGGGRNSGAEVSTRQQQEQKVVAVPDLRTGSVVVSAARDLMDEIAQMVSELDNDPAKKQKVFIFPVENTDVASVETLLRGLFETQNSRNRTSSSQANTRQTGAQLNNLATSNMQNQGRSTGSGFGTTQGGGTRR